MSLTMMILAVALLALLLRPLGVATADLAITSVATRETREFPIAANETLYKGAFVGLDPAGYAKTFVPGDKLLGLCAGYATGGATAGVYLVTVYIAGTFQYALTSVALTDVGKPAFATADNALALTGHPDAFVGHITRYVSSNTCWFALKEPGARPPRNGSCIDIDIDFAKGGVLPAGLDEGSTGAILLSGLLEAYLVGAGLTAGTTGLLMDDAVGELKALLDNDNEAQNLTIQTPQVFNITKGFTFEFEGRNSVAGASATSDMDFGVAGLTGKLTATERADMNAATAGLKSCLYHLDCNSLNVYASSDDNAAPVAAVDTTFDNSLTVNHKFVIIGRPGGVCELWIDGVRKLASQFSVSAAGLFCGIVNLEKNAVTDVPELRIRRLRMAGAIA